MLISLLFELLDLRAVKALDLRLAASRQVVHPCSATTSVSSSLAVISILLVQKSRQVIIHVPEGRRLFAGMNVGDNLLMGACHRSDGTAAIRRDLDFVFGLFPRLYERWRQDASTLSGGEQKMYAIARELMAAPQLLMIDELSLGLAPRIAEELSAVLIKINQSDVSILVVEQDVVTVLELSHQAFVMDSGWIVRDGPSKNLTNDPFIREAYLGVAFPVARSLA